MRNFLVNNCADILLIVVGLSAFAIYFIQERRKISEAASLISIQIEDLQKQICTANSNVDIDYFWKQYREFQNNMYIIINNKAFTTYIPEQIRITLENALKMNNSIQIIGCEGYRKLKKLAKR